MKPTLSPKKLASGLLLLVLVIFMAPELMAQVNKPLKITGRVIDIATNESLPGVNITVKGTQTGTVTDINGNYSIEALKDSTLVFSFIGYQNKEMKVGNLQTIDIGLSLSVAALDEVVVIGYGTTTKKEVTGSIATIKTEEFNKGRYSDPMGLIQARLPVFRS